MVWLAVVQTSHIWTVCRIVGRPFESSAFSLPTTGVTHAEGGVPRNCDDLVERALEPDRVVVVEIDDPAERLAVVRMILQVRGARECADPDLNELTCYPKSAQS
jgi:hypothetical protein